MSIQKKQQLSWSTFRSSWGLIWAILTSLEGKLIIDFLISRITNQEAKYKLCRVREIKTGPKNVPYLYTSDGRTIRYPDPIVKANDSIRYTVWLF